MLTREEDIDVHALRKRGWTISAIARHLRRDRGVSEKMHQFAEVIPDQDAVVIADPA